MGAHPNLTIARALWDAIADADPEAIRKLFSNDSVWTVRGSSPMAGRYVGADAIMVFLGGVGEGCDDMVVDLIDIPVSERGATIHYRVEAMRGERRLAIEQLLVTRIVGGEIVSADLVPADQAAHDAFWSD